MNRVKKIIKCLIIYIVISMMILSNVAYGYTSAEVGSAVAGYTLNLLSWGNKEENYCDGLGGYGPALRYNQCGTKGKNRLSHPTLDNPEPELPWFYDCSSFSAAMYNMVFNQVIMDWSSTTSSDWDSKFDRLGSQSSTSKQPGDVINNVSSHVEIFISDEYGTGGAHGNGVGVNNYSNKAGQVDCGYESGRFASPEISPSNGYVFRIKESVASTITDLNTEFSITGIGSKKSGTINYSNFFFNGIPDGKYSLASQKGVLSIIVDLLMNILDYLIGVLTYIIRIVFVGWTAIFDNLLNWTVNTLTSTGTTAAEANISATEIVQTETDDRKVTIENLLFNKLDLLDINIFKTE